MNRTCLVVGVVVTILVVLAVAVAVLVVVVLPAMSRDGDPPPSPNVELPPPPEPRVPPDDSGPLQPTEGEWTPQPPDVPSDAGGVPEWEYVTELLDPHGGLTERRVDFEGRTYANSLAGSPYSREQAFFLVLAELPAAYTEQRPLRLEGVFAVDDASAPDAAFQFELRLNNGSPDVFEVKPNSPAHFDVSMAGIYRVDVTASRTGSGSGRPVVVEPKFSFR